MSTGTVGWEGAEEPLSQLHPSRAGDTGCSCMTATLTYTPAAAPAPNIHLLQQEPNPKVFLGDSVLSLHGSGAKKSLLLPCLQTAEGQEQPHPARRGRNLWVTVPPRAQKFWDLCAPALAAMPAASAQQHGRLGLVQPGCIFFSLSAFIWFDLF